MYNFVTLKELRPRLPGIIEAVDERMDRYIVARHGHPVAVLLSISDFEGLVETAEEVADKDNLRRIRRGIREARMGRTVDWRKVKEKYGLLRKG